MQKEIARCNSVVIVEDGERWIFGQQSGAADSSTLIYVIILIAFVVSINGLLFLMGLIPDGGVGVRIAGGGMIASGVGLGFLSRHLIRRRRRARENTHSVRALLILDFAERVLRSGDGKQLAPLERVTFSKDFQLTSSSKALRCRWDGGSLVVMSGTPFSDSIDAGINALQAKGFRIA